MLSFGATCVAESPLPEDSHTPSAGVSDGCAHAPVHLVMHCHQDQERSCLRASFNAAVLWGGNRLQWWLIYTIDSRGIKFFSPHFCLSSICYTLFVFGPLLQLSVSEGLLVLAVKQALHNSRRIFSSPKCCFLGGLHLLCSLVER